MTTARASLQRYAGVTPVASVQGTLALDLHRHLDPPEPSAALGGPRPAADVVAIDDAIRRRAELWAQRYVQAAVEIVGGDRPVNQLLRWTTPEVYADLSRRAQLVARAAGRPPGVGRPRAAVRPQVVSVRAGFVTRDACEVSARVRHGERHRAVAARFEMRHGRLQCSALEFA